jgi:hypothetical protein
MDPLVIPIVALSIPIFVVPVALGVKYAQRLRELEHQERMKALELGRTLPQDEAWWSPAKICVLIGAGVPIGSSFCAYLATESRGYHQDVWMSSMLVGIAGVVCGTVLAAKHFNYRAEAERAASLAKARVDADAFDVVGTRG